MYLDCKCKLIHWYFFLRENMIIDTSLNFAIQEVFPRVKISFFPDLEKSINKAKIPK